MAKIKVFRVNNTIRSVPGWFKRCRTFLRRNNTNILYSKFSLKFITVKTPSRLNYQTGFSLVELLTAVAILTILATIGLVTINPIEQLNKGSDAKKKADLGQIQRGLEVYYNDYGRYPPMSNNKICRANTASPGVCATEVNWGSDWRPYMDVLPVEKSSNKRYAYWTDSSGQSYRLYASLARGGRDLQACNGGLACQNAQSLGIQCGTNIICDYGVTSPNVAP